jgi:hypothetical protein
MKIPKVVAMTAAVVAGLTMIGCDENQRIAELAQRELEHRAAETQQLAELHSKVQEERLELGQGRDQLEEDRRQIANQRHRDPLIANAINSVVWLLVCVLPLFVCWRLLQPPDEHEIEQSVSEILISDFVAEEPLLLPKGRPALPRDSNGESTA